MQIKMYRYSTGIEWRKLFSFGTFLLTNVVAGNILMMI